MDYFNLRILHVGLATVSFAGFVLRWIWMMNGDPKHNARLTRILPHVIDTLFLASGILLVYTIAQYPLTHAWLTAKLLGLVTYICLGSVALKRAATRHGRVVAFLAS
ncbi:MAG: regulator SirB, partial [Xanthomonadales bacterium]|nr:SirB2 family protein [Xanthomonadales bacterium]NIX11833.1 regulator SirB [Xanthomonadales bacterium]